jgi:hypothetical protein
MNFPLSDPDQQMLTSGSFSRCVLLAVHETKRSDERLQGAAAPCAEGGGRGGGSEGRPAPARGGDGPAALARHAHARDAAVQPYHSSTIHLLQAFQAVEAAVRQFYFSYQQLVIAVMGSGEYKATAQTEFSAADALSQIYFEPPYFPSLDGAKTFLGSFWHNNPELEEGAIMRQLMVEKTMRSNSSKASSVANSDSGDSDKGDGDDERTQKV